MRRLLLLAVVLVATLVVVEDASATRECNGFRVCVPVAGPWVLAPSPAQTQWQLACPPGFIVGGLDAELTSRALDLGFDATLGSPVNPGISTSTTALFRGRLVAGSDPAASFRPRIGCIPAAGGGQRIPTAVRTVYPPGRPTVVRASQVAVRAGATRRLTRACRRGERLVTASDAIGFDTAKPPTRALAAAVQVARATKGGLVTVTIRAGAAARGGHAVVQLDLVCAGGG